MRNFYDMLSVKVDAPADEIKKAFRREIARYHPDKVQHLGPEFQEMASAIAADLTEAYRILMDAALRTKYDEDLFGGVSGDPSPAPPRPPAPAAPRSSAPPPQSASVPSGGSWEVEQPVAARPSPAAGIEFVKKASLSRLKAAAAEVMGDPDPSQASGFDVAMTSKPKRGLFKKADDPVRLLVKFVTLVDAAAVAEVWPAALRGKVADATLCVLLLGSGLAPSQELASAVGDQRRKARNTGPVLVPVDVRDWEALFPPDTPASVRLLIQRLKDGKR